MPAKKAFGTKIQAEVTTPGTFADIAQVTNIKPFDIKADIVDASSHDSPGQMREKLAGFLDNGECQVDINYDNANTGHKFLQNNVGQSKDFKIVFPGPTTDNTVAFTAIIKGFSGGAPYNDKLTASVVLDISGVLTWSTGA